MDELATQDFPWPRDVPVLALASRLDDPRGLALWERSLMFHLITWDAPQLASRILTATSKLVCNDLFGLEKYLTWGSALQRAEVIGLPERHLAVANLGAFMNRCGMDRRLVIQATTVADELLSNALRSQPGAPVELAYAFDEDAFALSVRDAHGTLDRTTLREFLGRALARAPSMEEDDDGAGLGIYVAFSLARELVFNLAPGVQTEVIALFGTDPDAFRQPSATSRAVSLFDPAAAV